MFDREVNGRIAKAEISVYDGILAEIMGEKDARMRKFERTHNLRNDGKPQKKDKRKCYEKEMSYSCDPYIGFDTARNFRSAEKIRTDAIDYKIELENIADDLYYAQVEAEYRAWNERIEYERKMRKLNEWLKYA